MYRSRARLMGTGHCGHDSFVGAPGVGADSTARNTHTFAERSLVPGTVSCVLIDSFVYSFIHSFNNYLGVHFVPSAGGSAVNKKDSNT